MAKAEWRKKCSEAAEKVNIDVDFYDDRGRAREFEDDGYLHVRRFGLRAVFDVGKCQTASGAEQNERTLAVLKVLDVAYRNADVLVVEDDDDDGVCPTCGRGGAW